MTRHRTWLMRVTAVVALLAVGPATHANLIINGGFEEPAVFPPNPGATLGGSDLTGWSVDFSAVFIFNDALMPTFEGRQGLELSSYIGGGGISQSFSTVVGQAYILSFAYGNNPNQVTLSATVSVSGSTPLLSETISHSTSTVDDMDYTLFSRTFVADSTTTTLAFASNNPVDLVGIVLDAVSVNPALAVPEPSSLALGSIGVVTALGGLWRRRKR